MHTTLLQLYQDYSATLRAVGEASPVEHWVVRLIVLRRRIVAFRGGTMPPQREAQTTFRPGLCWVFVRDGVVSSGGRNLVLQISIAPTAQAEQRQTREQVRPHRNRRLLVRCAFGLEFQPGAAVCPMLRLGRLIRHTGSSFYLNPLQAVRFFIPARFLGEAWSKPAEVLLQAESEH